MLIHDALNDYITCGDTSVVAYQLRMAIRNVDKEEDGQSGFEQQFEVRTHYLPCCNVHNFIFVCICSCGITRCINFTFYII